MKIKIRSVGETEFDLDAEYQEPAIREAIEDGCNDVPSAIIDYTDTERSDISHDEHATVTEDDGTVLWSGWLHGDPGDEPWGPANVVTVEMHRWYAVVRNGGHDADIVKVIGNSDDGLTYYDSIAEWEAANT